MLSLKKDDAEKFTILKKLIYENIDGYKNSERSNLFIKLKNYCAYSIYKGDTDFYEEKYLVFKKELGTVKYNSDGVGPLYVSIYLEVIQKAVLENDLQYAKKSLRNLLMNLKNQREIL